MQNDADGGEASSTPGSSTAGLRADLERIIASWVQQARSKFQAADRERAKKPSREMEARALEHAACICMNHVAELRRLIQADRS